MFLYKKKISKWKLPLIAVATILTSVTFSCKKILDVQATHVSAEPQQWKSITDTKSALLGIYGLFRAALSNNDAQWLYGELRAGDFSVYNRNDLSAINRNELNASFPVLQDLSDWRRFYAIVNSASVFIEHAPKVQAADSRYSDVNLKYDIAQARALRAFAYFYMVRIWGDVPLLTEAYDNGNFAAMPKTSAKTVLDFCERELNAAAADLPYLYGVSPESYYGANQGTWSGALLNKISAYALLAHVAAWEGNYVNVDVYTSFVLNNYTNAKITYTDVNTLTAANGLFSQRFPSQIVAFGAMDINGESSQSGHIEELTLAQPIISRQKPDIFLSRDTIASIFTDPYDFRFGTDTVAKAIRTNYISNYNSDMPVFSKIKVLRDGVTDGTYPIYGSVILFTRLEEITLLRAEAQAVLGRRDDAILSLNTIKSARGIPIFVADSPENIVDAIFAERRRELLGEGWRWYDLIRYNRIRQNNPAFNALIQNGGIYWPIAANVLSANNLVQQNPYWK
ncbi:MAG: RagB/SusD family nutrient uptake outer membrane protein [Mucilaginibacter sp.]|nr:RagB/SusD family nutrient uptake outer membrane protein [Mucilaginibacter sp.]